MLLNACSPDFSPTCRLPIGRCEESGRGTSSHPARGLTLVIDVHDREYRIDRARDIHQNHDSKPSPGERKQTQTKETNGIDENSINNLNSSERYRSFAGIFLSNFCAPVMRVRIFSRAASSNSAGELSFYNSVTPRKVELTFSPPLILRLRLPLPVSSSHLQVKLHFFHLIQGMVELCVSLTRHNHSVNLQ